MRALLAEAVEPRVFLLRQLRMAGSGLVAVTVALNAVLGLLPVAFVVATSVVIGRAPAAAEAGADSAQWWDLALALAVTAAVFACQQLLTPLQLALVARVKHRVDGQTQRRLMAVSLRSTGIGPMEDQENLALLRQAADSLENGFRTPGDAAAGMLAYVVRYLRLAGFAFLVGLVTSWWLAVALVISTMAFRHGHRSGLRMYARLWPQVIDHRRERDYFRDLGLGAAPSKEIRIFHLAEWIGDRYRTSALASLAPLWRERRRVTVRRFGWYTVAGLAVAVLVFVEILRAGAAGELSLTEVTLGLQAMLAAVLLGEFYHEADPATQFGMLSVRALSDLEARITTSTADELAGPPASAAGLPRRDIRFAGVSFTYPAVEGSEAHQALAGLDLTLRAGECTALVGLNGAGKTTLVKLLARLYEPDSGAVLVDGRDLREFPVECWRRQLGVIFQDFNRYELTVADNIAFGAVERPISAGHVDRAAAQAGMADVIAGLPRGRDTVLSRQHDGGAELSGGQWQRLAIARALYAVEAGARVLVLDEPTAALDVRAEAAFFREFADLTSGLTTLLISHRFSSVRLADRILVLEGGRIVEDGSHDALLAQGGRYATLFKIQSERFDDGADDESDGE